MCVVSFQLFSWLESVTGYHSLNDLPLPLSVPLGLLALLLHNIIMYFPLACFALLTWEDCWKVPVYTHKTCIIIIFNLVYGCSEVLLIFWNFKLDYFPCCCCPKHEISKTN